MIKLITIYIMSGFYVWVGIKHFISPTDPFMHIMPPYLPFHLELVYLSGAFEIILGLLLLYKGTRTIAAWGLILLLVVVFPANIYLAFNEEPQQLIGISAFVASWIRLPIQGVFIALAYWHSKG